MREGPTRASISQWAAQQTRGPSIPRPEKDPKSGLGSPNHTANLSELGASIWSGAKVGSRLRYGRERALQKFAHLGKVGKI